MSEGGIIKALVGVMGEIGAIAKTRKNPQQGYNFRGIDDIYNAIQPALIKHGVVIVPAFEVLTREERPSKSGGVLYYTTVKGVFRLSHIDGSGVNATAIGEGMDSSDKSTNKAMSAAFKYALLQTLCIPTEEHIDSERETPQPVAKPQPTPPQPPPPEPDDRCTKEQREKIFGKAMGRWNDRDKARDFYLWMAAPEIFLTKEEASDLIEHWEERVADYEEANRLAGPGN
jgi:hypothetical protein